MGRLRTLRAAKEVYAYLAVLLLARFNPSLLA